MKKSRFSESQIVAILKEVELGAKVGETCRKHGVSAAVHPAGQRFNKIYRTEVLDCYVFDSLQEVRDMTADWLHRYNHHRPHEALGRIPPVEYRVKLFPNLCF